MDLLDYALSADTVNTVRTMREVLASGVEPLLLVSQLGALITDILVGSREVNRETRGQGFFNRNLCKHFPQPAIARLLFVSIDRLISMLICSSVSVLQP